MIAERLFADDQLGASFFLVLGLYQSRDAEDGIYTRKWHESRGFWFNPPSLTLQQGWIVITLPPSLQDLALRRGVSEEDLTRIGTGDSLSMVYGVDKRLDTAPALARGYKEFIERSLALSSFSTLVRSHQSTLFYALTTVNTKKKDSQYLMEYKYIA